MSKFSKVFSFIFLCMSLSAWGHVPPSRFILETWTKKRSTGLKTVRIKSLITAYEKGVATPVHFKETLLYSPGTSEVKSVATDDQEQKLYLSEKTLESSPLGLRVLLSADFGKIFAALKDRGIPFRSHEELKEGKPEEGSLVRIDGHITRLAWKIEDSSLASEDKEDDWNAQYLAEKDTFLPLKLVYLDPRNRNTYSMLFSEFKYSREYSFPRVFQVLKKGEGMLF